MYILTKVSGGGDLVQIYDSTDRTQSVVSFESAMKMITEQGERVYGLRAFDQSELYSPDCRVKYSKDRRSILGVVVPTEAYTAAKSVGLNKK